MWFMEEVTAKDILARFILERKKYSPVNNTVKFRAFLPNHRRELSIFVINNWTEEKIWQVGQEFVAAPQGKSHEARGDVSASKVWENDLSIELDNTPPGHANVLGWPDKSEQKAIAIKLAQAAKLVINPSAS